LRRLGGILGLLKQDPERYLKGGRAHEVRLGGSIGLTDREEAVVRFADEQIEALIVQRTAARKAKNWAESDRIRDELKRQGVVLEDGPTGTTWRRA
jgi:cysteinyl-tRNA synthetase